MSATKEISVTEWKLVVCFSVFRADIFESVYFFTLFLWTLYLFSTGYMRCLGQNRAHTTWRAFYPRPF